MKAVICPVCNGEGKLNKTTGVFPPDCHGCDGKGWVEVHEDPITHTYIAPLFRIEYPWYGTYQY